MATGGTWDLREGDELSPGLHAVQLLGGGHRYEAYLAWSDDLRALVVAKVLRPRLVADRRALDGLAREARALGELAHPSLVRAFGARLDGERPHLVLEHLDGPRLSTLLRRYRVIVEQLLPLGLELCAALHYLSTRRWLHLDVKPRNIVMSAAPRLIDLSVATRLDEVALLRSPTGTDAYMAPEQCDPDLFGELGPTTDVWGLGVTLYEALARTLPFPRGRGTAGPERFPQLAAEPAALPADVPAPLAAAIGSCLERRPENRPAAAELADVLEPLAASLPRPRLGLFRPGTPARPAYEVA